MARVLVVADHQALVDGAAAVLADEIAGVLGSSRRCSVALAGGSTPRPVYERLAGEPYRSTLDWSRLEVYFGDERAVPPDHPESNYRMAREALLDRVPIRPEAVHPMYGVPGDLEAAARAYEARLPAALDVLILGMGSDGHTASLFPGSAAASEESRRVAVVPDAPLVPRLTITPPTIRAARSIVVLVSGQAKAERLAEVLEGPLDPVRLPSQLARGGVWIVDQAAAGRLAQEAS
jgi:6-phosphogluconolactonase